ncbi:hypothetical protein HYH02_011116 [Chlamydomonas schloesseri]|uniref:Uncharacterized protein n=1 Tax=Chlamydomonas schloesseri TaxID=2026947 RepID=A0A835W3A7_9CHLO|nr:hypothetical protein HYH02_011116 [Chlamydomonas schloesseri]|eukprot:KAG2437740.1 hypothetical protein HYH02_011116 [Chlamydomonas schloesseri]
MLLEMVGATDVVVVAAVEGGWRHGGGGGGTVAFHEAGLNRTVAGWVAAAAAAAGGIGGGGGGRYAIHPMPRACFDDTQGGRLLSEYATPDSAAAHLQQQLHSAGGGGDAGGGGGGGGGGGAASRTLQYLALGAAGALLHWALGPEAVHAALGGVGGVGGRRSRRGGGGGGAGAAAAFGDPYGAAAAAAAAPLLPPPPPLALRRGCLRLEALDAGLYMTGLTGPGGLAEALEVVGGGRSLQRLLGAGVRTRAGARLLRSSLLQPLADADSLELRYDTVGELAADGGRLGFDAGQVLAQLPPDLDKMCYSLAAAGLLEAGGSATAAGGGGGGGGGAAGRGGGGAAADPVSPTGGRGSTGTGRQRESVTGMAKKKRRQC